VGVQGNLFFDTNVEGDDVAKPQKLYRAVRVLEESVRLAEKAAQSGTSIIKSGKLTDSLRNDIAALHRLAEKNAQEQFNKVLQRAVNKLVKLCRKSIC
jgi:hypothetical protein